MRSCSKNRHKLSALVDDIWQWENVGEALLVARRSRLDSLHVALRSPCTCGGRWRAVAVDVLDKNRLDKSQLCRDIYASLLHGRCETVPVVVFAGKHGGEGKSLLLKPLKEVFGAVVIRKLSVLASITSDPSVCSKAPAPVPVRLDKQSLCTSFLLYICF